MGSSPLSYVVLQLYDIKWIPCSPPPFLAFPIVQKNQIPKLSATHPLNLQRLIFLASLWLIHPSRAWFLVVIEPSEHDGKTCVVQKNQIPKLSITHPLNLQRSIFLASLWLIHPSRACFLGVIEPSEHDGKTCFVQKNHILKLSTTHPLVPEPAKVDFSILTMTCMSFKSMLPGGYWTLWTRWKHSLCPEKSNSKVVYHSPPEPAKVYFSSLTMTCKSFKSMFPRGYWTVWTRW